jgi:hypothetical protein
MVWILGMYFFQAVIGGSLPTWFSFLVFQIPPNPPFSKGGTKI